MLCINVGFEKPEHLEGKGTLLKLHAAQHFCMCDLGHGGTGKICDTPRRWKGDCFSYATVHATYGHIDPDGVTTHTNNVLLHLEILLLRLVVECHWPL